MDQKTTGTPQRPTEPTKAPTTDGIYLYREPDRGGWQLVEVCEITQKWLNPSEVVWDVSWMGQIQSNNANDLDGEYLGPLDLDLVAAAHRTGYPGIKPIPRVHVDEDGNWTDAEP